ncbi:helix-hairpin-helix domain-containing protein [bacterium]|nr:helix-hairpin-helix domain-containing protein [bacterium]
MSQYLNSWEARAALVLAALALAGFWAGGALERRAAARSSLPAAAPSDSLARRMLEREYLRRSGPVAVNHATAGELTGLEGIGPELAGRIVAERSSGGPFRDGADLASRVRGIGPATVARLAGRLLFSDTLEAGEP